MKYGLGAAFQPVEPPKATSPSGEKFEYPETGKFLMYKHVIPAGSISFPCRICGWDKSDDVHLVNGEKCKHSNHGKFLHHKWEEKC